LFTQKSSAKWRLGFTVRCPHDHPAGRGKLPPLSGRTKPHAARFVYEPIACYSLWSCSKRLVDRTPLPSENIHRPGLNRNEKSSDHGRVMIRTEVLA
jgi:hypothetical protein